MTTHTLDENLDETRIIISGTVDLPPERLDQALADARPLIEGALTEPGCLDYDWCPDPLRPGRVRVFERWASEAALEAHFAGEWYRGMRDHLGVCGIQGASTAKFRVDASERVYDATGTPRAGFMTAPSGQGSTS
jgi:quinol monooxygenase YgiN